MVYFLLADGFEEIEALTPVDLLRRAGVAVTTVSYQETRAVTGSHAVCVTADTTVKDLLAAGAFRDDMEMLVFPGGMPGAKNLDARPETDTLIDAARDRNAYLCAICAAPMILGKRGLLRGKKATCFPSFETHLEGAVLCLSEKVVRDGNIITGCGMGAAFPFGLALAEAMAGKETADRLRTSILL